MRSHVMLVLLAFVAACGSTAGEPPSESTPSAPGSETSDASAPAIPASDAAAAAATSDDASAPAAPPARGTDGLWHVPDPAQTPGVLCTATDPNFEGYAYPEHIAKCTRNVSPAEKDQVAAEYGIAKASYASFEFDHFIPLSIGGSDDPKNLWPQPVDEAKQKDVLEEEVFQALSSGAITQAEAIAKIRAWRPK